MRSIDIFVLIVKWCSVKEAYGFGFVFGRHTYTYTGSHKKKHSFQAKSSKKKVSEKYAICKP